MASKLSGFLFLLLASCDKTLARSIRQGGYVSNERSRKMRNMKIFLFVKNG